ncbi:MAG: tRNA uridine-5-carboxymethylaminomethyl(34) synthesis GTPase MnmE [Succiniclasticum sp.]|jgi:tRNA modification GTPase trmE|nr:tRNA uridine-5-carboxymethylaminomethyl(34) synthesis GTPase MnmE [Selenomonadales bacterium]MDY2870653.1 tRNA uridine-5-carboxymethylaminomethyl(34) synthesis GTPase MnmE [Succiniclasticum sp.]MDY6303243.1 tRNA uridine-5-carboxymethylaminomethyl(34) synthesis GTPase MnmE [Succiniclasticum sp.]MDY6346624.1 tRNA uridine-5-carboxymethylaminomethyl(34) synthesis GTPase MnmE [Succiniclasticum sp.]
MYQEDTISAVTTPLGLGAVGIVRLSGPSSLALAEQMFRPASGKPFRSYAVRTMVYGTVVDETGAPVDEVLCVYMKAPHSYTAEDVVEFQCHGGTQSLRRILALTYRYGARPAEPGEYTRRAFLNGRIDLVQAEAVMDIIHSRSAAALASAVRQQEGALSKELKGIRKALKDVLVHLEAVIDYPEEDIEDVTYPEVARAIGTARAETDRLLQGAHTGRILREGLRTAIVGRPNVGKSSLLNKLLRQDRALVSEYAGTTRDVIEEQLVIGGVPILLADTAGIRETEDFVEKMGVEKSRHLLSQAELVLVVVDAHGALTAEDEEILAAAAGKACLVVLNKADLGIVPGLREHLAARFGADHVLPVSARTGEGTDELGRWLQEFVYGAEGYVADGLYLQNERQIALLRQARENLAEAEQGAADRLPYDCLTIDVDAALTLMGEITGETVRDEIIHEIFARFCVGK